jgi:hypothetical protein
MSLTKDWRKICAACHEGEPPEDCEFYGEPNGCNSPTYGEHPTCKESLQVGDRMLDLLNRVHNFLGKLCRDGRCDDHCSECIGASDLADDVWDLIQSCKEHSQVGNAAAMYEALKAVVKVGYPHNFQHEAPHIRGYCYEITTAINKCFAALATPPRNCDKCLTPKDAMLAHLKEVYEGEKVEFGDYEWCEFVKWLFAEAKGEAK